MTKQKPKKLHKNIQLAYQRVMSQGGVLCRQHSSTDEALKVGGGFIYFTPAGKPVPPASARFMIEKEIVEPVADGLFGGTSQTFRAIDRQKFERFKNDYEQMQVRVG